MEQAVQMDPARREQSQRRNGCIDAIMSENPALAKIVGKRITAVVMTEGVGPEQRFFLVFDDNTYYELYGGVDLGICLGGGPYQGDLAQVRELAAARHQIVFEAISPQEWTRVKVGRTTPT